MATSSIFQSMSSRYRRPPEIAAKLFLAEAAVRTHVGKDAE
jgi:hypothetical protein